MVLISSVRSKCKNSILDNCRGGVYKLQQVTLVNTFNLTGISFYLRKN